MKIESGIPIPVARAGGSHKRSPIGNDMRKLKVNQSFFVESHIHRVNSYKFIIELETRFKFTCRSRTEKGVMGTRVWRIA